MAASDPADVRPAKRLDVQVRSTAERGGSATAPEPDSAVERTRWGRRPLKGGNDDAAAVIGESSVRETGFRPFGA